MEIAELQLTHLLVFSDHLHFFRSLSHRKKGCQQAFFFNQWN